jgi:hypothetical protein
MCLPGFAPHIQTRAHTRVRPYVGGGGQRPNFISIHRHCDHHSVGADPRVCPVLGRPREFGRTHG